MARVNNVVVVTGNLGPGRSVTSMRLENVSSLTLDFDRGIIAIETGIRRHEFAYTGVTGIATSISNGVTTVTIT
jgi:hypothetical protein